MRKLILLTVLVGFLASSATAASWHNTEQTVTLNPSDEESGVKDTYYCIDQSDSCQPRTDGQKYTGPFTVSAEGINYVRYNSKDNVGNVEPTESKIVKIDYTNPETTDDYPGGWQNTSMTVELTCNDPENPDASGCTSTVYCVDQSDTCTPSNSGKSIDFSSEGVYYLRYRSSDVAGNTESVQSTTVKMDYTDPQVLVNKVGTGTSGSKNASASCTDSLSGCQESSARIWASESPAFECPTGVSQYSEDSPFNVQQHLWVCAAQRDRAGNWDDSGEPVEFSIGTLTVNLNYPGKPGLVTTSKGSKIPISVAIRNEKENTRNINVSMTGVPAKFENGKGYSAVELDGVEDQIVYGLATPEETGNQTLIVRIEDKTEGFVVNKEINIRVKESGARTSSTGKDVPGIGLMQLMALMMLGTTYYWMRMR